MTYKVERFRPAQLSVLQPSESRHLRTEVRLQNHSGFKPGCVIFAPGFQFFPSVGASLTGEYANK
jgi:hypothetical protein